MAWANARRRVVVDFDVDPHGGYAISLARTILRRVQGVGLHSVVGFDGAPETTYGGSYAPAVQSQFTGAAARIASPSVNRDLGSSDLSSGVTSSSTAAAQMFAERLRRGRVS